MSKTINGCGIIFRFNVLDYQQMYIVQIYTLQHNAV